MQINGPADVAAPGRD